MPQHTHDLQCLQQKGGRLYCSALVTGRRSRVSTLSHDAAWKIVQKLRMHGEGKPALRAEIVADPRAPHDPNKTNIVFKGGKHGEHSLALSVTNKERILSHWEGYVRASGYGYSKPAAPKLNSWVSFPSGSSPTGRRNGKVIKIAKSRALIRFAYKGSGHDAQTWRPFEDLRPSHPAAGWFS